VNISRHQPSVFSAFTPSNCEDFIGKTGIIGKVNRIDVLHIANKQLLRFLQTTCFCATDNTDIHGLCVKKKAKIFQKMPLLLFLSSYPYFRVIRG